MGTLWRRLKIGPLSVLVVGGGNWGTVVAKIAAENTKASYIFKNKVTMWLHEEQYEGRPLTEVINERHENVKYLPGVKLPENLEASPALEENAEQADLIIMVLPHQFVRSTCTRLVGHVRPDARAISLVKGLDVEDRTEPRLFTALVEQLLGIRCCMLSGANVANDIAKCHFSETTLGYHDKDRDAAAVWQQLFDRPYFKVNGVPDVAGVEICGAIKNIIAVAAGFCDGLGYGTNTKAAVIRVGVEEMKAFARQFFDGILEETFFDSCGYADVITTCFGGRNVRCASEFVKRRSTDSETSWEQIELDLLKGQKMQGHLTARDVYSILQAKDLTEDFPLFSTIYRICFEQAEPKTLLDFLTTEEPRTLKDKSECSPKNHPKAPSNASPKLF